MDDVNRIADNFSAAIENLQARAAVGMWLDELAAIEDLMTVIRSGNRTAEYDARQALKTEVAILCAMLAELPTHGLAMEIDEENAEEFETMPEVADNVRNGIACSMMVRCDDDLKDPAGKPYRDDIDRREWRAVFSEAFGDPSGAKLDKFLEDCFWSREDWEDFWL